MTAPSSSPRVSVGLTIAISLVSLAAAATAAWLDVLLLNDAPSRDDVLTMTAYVLGATAVAAVVTASIAALQHDRRGIAIAITTSLAVHLGVLGLCFVLDVLDVGVGSSIDGQSDGSFQLDEVQLITDDWLRTVGAACLAVAVIATALAVRWTRRPSS